MQAAVEAAEDLAEVADEKVLTLQELMACYIGMANRGEEFGLLHSWAESCRQRALWPLHNACQAAAICALLMIAASLAIAVQELEVLDRVLIEQARTGAVCATNSILQAKMWSAAFPRALHCCCAGPSRC